MRNLHRTARFLTLGFLALIGACALLSPVHKTVTVTDVRNSGFDEKSHAVSFPEVLELARKAQAKIDADIHDYSAVMRKRERVSGQLPDEATFMFVKIREKPFSVFLHFLAPAGRVGEEVLYQEDRNNGYLQWHTTGLFRKSAGTVSLPPTGFLAMRGEMYPITRIGLRQLCNQLLDFAQKVPDPSKVRAEQFDQASVNDRACTLLKLVIPVTESGVRGYMVRIFVDKELGVPISLEVYKLLNDTKAPPQLFQEYTYLDLKVNRGYGDADFDKTNPKYDFP
jgi:hypothetical protein